MTTDEIRERLEAAGWVRNDVIHGSERWCGPDNRTFIYIYEDGAMRCGGGGDELERKQAVCQWLRDIVAVALGQQSKGRGESG